MKIEQLEIFISNFEETVAFYKDVMQFEILSLTNGTASFQTGESTFTLHKDEEYNHFYHFAFNINTDTFKEAKNWVQARTVLSKEADEDEAEFEDAGAMAFYFEDPAGNIVEFIARETSPNASESGFSPENVLGVSEIGVTVKDMKREAERLIDMGILPRNNEPINYDKYLNFMGEYEDGVYIILAPLGRRWIFSDKKGVEAPVIIKTNKGTLEFHNHSK
ncbi:VOC family protein [Clostridium polynesiense]|uniref:VOC family protein n=1 Tax=Clostridium polynesiense TaxID=1325933 RepID=UPI00058DCB68|nr:VOC family protein [Clostridium polynesiense]